MVGVENSVELEEEENRLVGAVNCRLLLAVMVMVVACRFSVGEEKVRVVEVGVLGTVVEMVEEEEALYKVAEVVGVQYKAAVMGVEANEVGEVVMGKLVGEENVEVAAAMGIQAAEVNLAEEGVMGILVEEVN